MFVPKECKVSQADKRAWELSGSLAQLQNEAHICANQAQKH